MKKVLAKSAESVQTALQQKGLTCKVVVLSDSTRTAEDAASAIGCDVMQIVKSLVFKTTETHRPVLILAAGSNRVSEKVIEAYISEKLTKADDAFVRKVTGFAIGGIPPLGHTQKVDLIFIDEDLLQFDSLWASAGTPHAVFNLKSKDLLDITNGKVISIK